MKKNIYSCSSKRKLLQWIIAENVTKVEGFDIEDYFICQKWSYPNNKYMDIEGTKTTLKDAINILTKFTFKTPTIIYTHQHSEQ